MKVHKYYRVVASLVPVEFEHTLEYDDFQDASAASLKLGMAAEDLDEVWVEVEAEVSKPRSHGIPPDYGSLEDIKVLYRDKSGKTLDIWDLLTKNMQEILADKAEEKVRSSYTRF